MSLLKCSECNNSVSEYAEKCPVCGCPINIIKKNYDINSIKYNVKIKAYPNNNKIEIVSKVMKITSFKIAQAKDIVDNYKYSQSVKDKYDLVIETNDEIEMFIKNIIEATNITNSEINGTTEGVLSVNNLVSDFGKNLDSLNTEMSNKFIIISDMINFLQQIKNIMNEK